MVTAKSNGWTARSLVLALAVSIGLLMVGFELVGADASEGAGWLLIIVPAFAGALVMATRHRGTWLLSWLLFFPVMVLFLILVAFAAFPGSGL